MKNQSIKIINSLALTSLFFLSFMFFFPNQVNSTNKTSDNSEANTIRVALLLDTSNSMDGLISQAKSQLWSIVNTLAEAQVDDEKAKLQIALYEYGNDGLSSENGFIRRVMPFSSDLDLLSEKLFALKTNGGSEYCGYVIKKAMDELDWKSNEKDLKLIFIAGNEAFDQGKVSFREISSKAKRKGLVINPIFCGDFEEGIQTYWKEAALITGGEYMSIDQNKKTVYIESPYDNDILTLNQRLNNTYIPYGSKGSSYKERQETQDYNAFSLGKTNKVKRAVSKCKDVYNNASWDLVDACQEKEFSMDDIETETLPEELRSMSDEELKSYIDQKLKERLAIQEEIEALNVKREKYVGELQKTESNLESAILKSIEKLAIDKGYKIDGC